MPARTGCRKRLVGTRSARTYASLFLAVVLGVALVSIAAPAFAYHSDGREGTYACTECHADGFSVDGAGVHGGYVTSTTKCRMCHTLHKAPAEGILLLPESTIDDSCMTCHDGTGGVGVYSAIEARGGTVQGEHTIGATDTVPGGTNKLSYVLGCASCHNVHRATMVESFTGDSHAAFYHGYQKVTNHLLRDDVGGHARGTFTKYGSDWCGGCHDQRMSVSAAHNHPIESSQTAGAFNYESLAKVESTSTTTTVLGALGGDNFGFVMPQPRTAQQGGHAPICQQCHEDARDVGSPGNVTEWETALKDYGVWPQPINPVFVTFPHQTTSRNLLAEQDDDLCLNCHDASMLP